SKSKNGRMRAQLDQQRQAQAQNLYAASENARLRRELHFVGSASFPRGFGSVGADIIAQPPSAFEQQVTISAGSSAGIQQNDPVMTDEGLVGTVVRAAPHVSLVALLTDDTTSVAAIDVETRARGVVKAGGSFDQVSKDQRVNKNDELVTSGWKSGSLSS